MYVHRRPETHKATFITPADEKDEKKADEIKSDKVIDSGPTIPQILLGLELRQSLDDIKEWIKQFDERVVFVHVKALRLNEDSIDDLSHNIPIAKVCSICSTIEKIKRGESRTLVFSPWVIIKVLEIEVPEPFIMTNVQLGHRSAILSIGASRKVFSEEIVDYRDHIRVDVTWP